MSKALRRLLDFRLFTRERVGQNVGLVVAIAAVTIALWSAKVQRDAMQLDERPYLQVSFERIEPTTRLQSTKEGTSHWSGYDAEVELKVSGKTPAFNIAARGKCLPTHVAERGSTDNGVTWRLWPFLFDEKQTLKCHFHQDLLDGNLPPNVTFALTVSYDDIFQHHHTTTFCEVIITMRGEGVPRQDAVGTVECDDFKFTMN